MVSSKRLVLPFALAWGAMLPQSHAPNDSTPASLLLERLPDPILASMQIRDRWFARLPQGPTAQRFLVEEGLRWKPGAIVKVAFLQGPSSLQKDIQDATKEITDCCNIHFDFGFDAQSNSFRSWALSDTQYSADIRVSFDIEGYWSLVGTDSTNPMIGGVGMPYGGAANQRSLNLGGFQMMRPGNWHGIVRHEFLHALGFQHEHQNPTGGCDDQFRWEDDAGYQPTVDQNGVFITDAAGRRPGIYTYLGGPPNRWPREQVDQNLRSLHHPGLTVGP